MSEKWLFPFDPENVELKPTRTGFGEGLKKLGEEDERVVVLGGDITGSVQTSIFRDAFPDRFFSIGIAEQNMATIAAGLSLTGKIPFLSTYGVFAAGRNWDQVRTTIAYTPCNVKIGGAHGGISVGPDGATHQALEEFATMRAIPNMTVFAPCDANQTFTATIAAGKMWGPVSIRFGREKVPNFTPPDLEFEIGKAQVFRKGDDITLIGTGHMTFHCMEAALYLEREGIDARVINLHTIKPIDTETVTAAAKETGAIVTAEEHQINGGMGSAVAEVLVRNHPVPVEMVAVMDRFGESGQPEELMQEFGLTTWDILVAAEKALKRKGADESMIEKVRAAAKKADWRNEK